jgi:hypothetical protein
MCVELIYKMRTYKNIVETFGCMSKYSKFILKFGAFYVIALATASLAFHIAAGRLTDYYYAMDISQQLFKCVNPSIGIIGLGIILFECACHVYAEDT